MPPEQNLNRLLANLSPERKPGTYVFTTVQDTAGIDLALPVATVREPEGTTLILRREIADGLGLPYPFAAAWITLLVHSDLAAVGLTAAVATALAERGMACNVIAGYYHDHLFIAEENAEDALEVLRGLAGT
ncbi:ACT domain-containing protein [Lewinella sp. IMCC34191]|uniref:ACT domain-containing protein n=1 Tax=Lewinella sp. IMCC34191 TaxID=2259172 RepID=UPI000E23F88E|nr:ACT domain-containing protein [Lewinella sp. IMCC34191]